MKKYVSFYNGRTEKDPCDVKIIWAKDLNDLHRIAEEKRNKKTENYCWSLPYQTYINSYGNII